MSKTTKRKHVTKEALTEYYVPEGEEEIVKILAGRGNNLHEVESADGRKFLVSMPTKFRKSLWVKRGDYVVVSPIKEGNKVLAEIIYVLYAKQIKYLQDEGFWPGNFNDSQNDAENDKRTVTSNLESDSSSNEDDELLFKNPNRKEFLLVEDDDSSSSEEEFSEEEGEGDDDSIKYEKTGVENELEDRNEDSGRENTNSLDSLAQKVKTVRFDE